MYCNGVPFTIKKMEDLYGTELTARQIEILLGVFYFSVIVKEILHYSLVDDLLRNC